MPAPTSSATPPTHPATLQTERRPRPPHQGGLGGPKPRDRKTRGPLPRASERPPFFWSIQAGGRPLWPLLLRSSIPPPPRMDRFPRQRQPRVAPPRVLRELRPVT